MDGDEDGDGAPSPADDKPVKKVLTSCSAAPSETLFRHIAVLLGDEARSNECPCLQAAAAMVVGVGSLSDPHNMQGLSHYLEHMLFMGSEQFPDENDYDSFLSKNGGGSNAYTELVCLCCTPKHYPRTRCICNLSTLMIACFDPGHGRKSRYNTSFSNTRPLPCTTLPSDLYLHHSP